MMDIQQKFPNLERIAGVARKGNAPEFSSPIVERAGLHLKDLADLLAAINGFCAFESALQVFVSNDDPDGLDLESWNNERGWISAYNEDVRKALFFAQDAFGFQFAIFSGGIFQFDPEIAEFTFVAEDLCTWWKIVLDDFEYLTGYELAREWQITNRPLSWNERLFPRRPFFIGGQFDTKNLFAMNSKAGAEFRAHLYSQTKDLPDGTQIQIEMGPPES